MWWTSEQTRASSLPEGARILAVEPNARVRPYLEPTLAERRESGSKSCPSPSPIPRARLTSW
jgi:hypothetical protein